MYLHVTFIVDFNSLSVRMVLRKYFPSENTFHGKQFSRNHFNCLFMHLANILGNVFLMTNDVTTGNNHYNFPFYD